MEENPWKTLESKAIYSNPWISLREDQVINPSGGNGIYGVVSFKNYAIGIIPLDHQLNTWLVGQYRYSLNEYSWEIPMGGGNIEVDIIDSAKRELKEETGIVAREWDLITRIHTSNSVTDEEGFIYVARDLEFFEPEFEETENLQIKKLPLAEAFKMVMENKITDSLSQSGILKVYAMLDLESKQLIIPENYKHQR